MYTYLTKKEEPDDMRLEKRLKPFIYYHGPLQVEEMMR